MKSTILLCAVLILAMAPAAFAQDKLYNFCNTPAQVQYTTSGWAKVPFGSSTIISLSGFKKVSFYVSTTKATSFVVSMGIMTATRAAAKADFTFPKQSQKIYTLDVVGPEMELWLSGAPAGTTETLYFWVWLHQ